MYRTYSPGESNQVAVVPSSSSPPAIQGSPTSAFPEDFVSSPPTAKRVNVEQLPAAFPFESFIGFSASAAAFSSFPPLDCDFGATAGALELRSGFDAYQQQQCEDTKPAVVLANYFGQSAGVMHQQQQQQQQQQHRRQQHQLPQMRSSLEHANAAQCKDGYSIEVYQEPEEYYRARYETEGIRGPLKGRENNHPAVRIIGPMTYSGTVHVSLVHEDGSKHTSCFLDETKDRQKALTKKIDPQSNMIVEFEDLRIRRETKSKNYSKEGVKKLDKAKTARNDKTACLCFTAKLQQAPNREIELIVLSKPIQLCAPPEGADLEWLIPEYGHANGDEKIVIKGTKMTCPKVTFTVFLPDSNAIELPGQVDKEQSHQNVLVVKTPRLPDDLRNFQGPAVLKADVRVSSGRAGTSSAPLHFYYIPNGVCHSCRQALPQTPLSIPMQPTTPFMTSYFSLAQCSQGLSFAGCSGGSSSPQHQHQCASMAAQMQSFHEPQVTYPPSRHCQEPMAAASVTLSHPPSISNASTPSPLPVTATGSHKDGFQQLFDSPTPVTAASHCTQSPNISPTSSPGPVSDSNNYWSLPAAVSSGVPISISQSQDLAVILPSEIQSVSASNSIPLVTSPVSEPVYSAVPSPDTTSSIYPPLMTYLDDSSAQYRQYP